MQLRAFYDADQIVRLDGALTHARTGKNRLAGDDDESLTRDMFLWRLSDEVSAFVMNPRIAELASALLGCRRIRFIQDVLMEKSGRQTETPWHRDSDFWGFSGIGALTLWIPLQDTPLAMSPMRYASGSHHIADPRPPSRIERACLPLRYRIASSALALGDVAVHHFKTLHGAARNLDVGHPRRSFAIHLIDADALVRAPRFSDQVEHAARCGWDRLADGDRFTDEIAPLI